MALVWQYKIVDVTPLFDDEGASAGTKLDVRIASINGEEGVDIDVETSYVVDVDMATVGDGYEQVIKEKLTTLVDKLRDEELLPVYDQRVKDSIEQKIEKLTAEVVDF
jgi:hypothetical protein